MDSSAILAIIFGEPDAERYVDAILASARPRMSSANWFEAAMVVDGKGDLAMSRRFDALLSESHIEVAALTHEHARLARSAWQRYGRSRHPARLNFGDCMAYALAAESGEPLLFKGNDFPLTDIAPALPA